MADLGEMQVRTLVDETDMGQLKAGLEAAVQVEAYPGRTFLGYVEKIEPQAVVQQNVTMFPVIVHLDNRSGLLKPGMNAEVEVLIDEATDVLLVPNNAIVNTGDVGPAAMVLGLEIEKSQNFAYRPPLKSEALLGRLEFLDKLGARAWPFFGSGYLVQAQKHVSNLIPLRPARNWRIRLAPDSVATSFNSTCEK